MSNQEVGRVGVYSVHPQKSTKKMGNPKSAVKEAPPVKNPVRKMNGPSNLQEADPTISLSSINLSELLCSGAFLKATNLIKFWVDERSKSNCFMLFPRTLSIIWSDHTNYWTWFPYKESPSDTIVEVAELKNVCWFDVSGKLYTEYLTPGTVYEVVFKVYLKDLPLGWDTANLKLVLPNCKDNPLEHKVDLRKLPRRKWVDISVGGFVPGNNSAGEITFSMYEHKDNIWKRGLFLKGVSIRPKHAN